MVKKILLKTALVLGITVGVIYILFLILPFIITPVVKGYLPTVTEEIKKASGFEVKIDGVKLVTTPKLTVGAKVGKFDLLTPDSAKIMSAEDFEIKMSLLPLLAKRIELDCAKLKDLQVNLNLNPDGTFEIEKYFTSPQPEAQTEEQAEEETAQAPAGLPFGFKLSNKLPDIRVGGYTINLADKNAGKSYVIKGNKTEITDFVLDKSVKILTDGSMTLAGREQFLWNIKVNNRIMPELSLNDLIFQPVQEEEVKPQEGLPINILAILKGIYDNKITANLNVDLKTAKNGGNLDLNGAANLSNLSVAPSGYEIPASTINLKFSGDKTEITSDLYTAKGEVSTLSGLVKTGKNTKIDLNFKSGANLSNIVKIVNAIAMAFDIKDLQTLSATGNIDANLNIKSNLKTVNSQGYFKIPKAEVNYGLYGVKIENISVDTALNNNNIDIKQAGFTILSQPLKLYGTISQDAKADLHLLGENLSLKGLLVAFGQAALLKENNVNSGLITLKADISGRLDSIKPVLKVVLSNINIKNIPSNTTLKLPSTSVDIVADGTAFSGSAVSSNIQVINPAAKVTVPKITANISEKAIEIPDAPVTVEKINFTAGGKIKDYLTPKIGLDFTTKGDIKSRLSGDVDIVKQVLNLTFAAPENSTIVVPMFDKSKMTFNGNIAITGNMMNPILSGTVNVPTLNIPEIPVTMENLTAKLKGTILNGNATVGKFTSGGIAAQNISSGFSLKGENFYLNNLSGSAFDGTFGGNIIYNISNFYTFVDFKGSGMNADKAAAGAAGIKNALNGTLGFNTKLSLTVTDYNQMMKSMKGQLSFRVDNGSFGPLLRFENFLTASNISSSSVLKQTVGAISNLAPVKESAKFSYIKGDMNFADGWANLKSIQSTGSSLAYYITGRYNLINGTVNVNILGRLDSQVVALLGPIGELSVDKLLSYIPKIGSMTASLVNTITSDPAKENISAIPALIGENKTYKDFKVVYNGGIESKSSIKSFKWLTKVDTSALQAQPNLTDTVKAIKTGVNQDVNQTIDKVKGVVDSVSSQKDVLRNSLKELKGLF